MLGEQVGDKITCKFGRNVIKGINCAISTMDMKRARISIKEGPSLSTAIGTRIMKSGNKLFQMVEMENSPPKQRTTQHSAKLLPQVTCQCRIQLDH